MPTRSITTMSASAASGQAHDIGPYELKQEPDAIEQISNIQSQTSQKIFRSGQILILHAGKTYTITGWEIRE